MTQTGITDSKSATAQRDSVPGEEPSQMSMQNGPAGAYIFNAVLSKFLRVIYSYLECFPRTPARRQFPMCAMHFFFFFKFLIQRSRQTDRERNKGPIVQLQISMQGSLLLPSPFHLSAISNFTAQHLPASLFITEQKKAF